MRYSSWDMRYGVRQTEYFGILHHFLPFYPIIDHQKVKFGKNVKSTWIYYQFTYVYHRWRSYDVWFLIYKVRWTEFFVILGHFLLFDPNNNPKNQNFGKMKKKKKKAWRYYHFTFVYHKWQSYYVWLLRYGAPQTEFLVILDHFLPFYPTNNLKNPNFEKMIKTPGDIILHWQCLK